MKTIFNFLVLIGMGLAYSSYGYTMDKKEKVIVVCGDMEEDRLPQPQILRIHTNDIESVFKLSEEYKWDSVVETCRPLEKKRLAAKKIQKLLLERKKLLKFLRAHKHTEGVRLQKATYTSGISAGNNYCDAINQLEQDLEFLRFLVRRYLTTSNTH